MSRSHGTAPLRRTARFHLLGALILAVTSACASVEFTRDTETSGHFVSKGLAFTILSWDVPKGALLIAQENMSDARQPNVQVDDISVWPYWGSFDWILDIISVRSATISGTWGFPGD